MAEQVIMLVMVHMYYLWAYLTEIIPIDIENYVLESVVKFYVYIIYTILQQRQRQHVKSEGARQSWSGGVL